MDSFLEEIRAASGDASQVLDLTLRRLQADTGTIHELGSDGLLHLKAWAGPIPEDLLPVIQRIPIGKGIAGLAVERKAPVSLCNLQTDDGGAARPRARETGVKGSICVPILLEGKAVGALGLGSRKERDFQEDEIALLMQVSRILGQCLSSGS